MIDCERGHMIVAKYLIENGTDIHATRKSGDTALWWAFSYSKQSFGYGTIS